MIPDTMDSDTLGERNRINAMFGVPTAPPPPTYPLHNPDGLIVPRKPQNPCLESRGHKDLHRELLFNKKVGKSVVGQRSELQRALDQRHADRALRQAEHEKQETPLARTITERTRRLEMKEAPPQELVAGGPEFLQVHAKLRSKMDSK